MRALSETRSACPPYWKSARQRLRRRFSRDVVHHEYGGRGFGSAVVSKEVMEAGKIVAGRIAALIDGFIEQVGKMN